MTGWKPPEGSKSTSKSEFWSPSVKGETMVGVVKTFDESYHGPYIELSPVIHHKADGETVGYGAVLVGLNSWLKKVIHKGDHLGKPLGIQYTGKQPTPSGKMFTYDVFELSDDNWRKERDQFLKDLPDDDEPPF